MPASQQDDDGEVQIVLVSSQLPDAIKATLEQEHIWPCRAMMMELVKSNSEIIIQRCKWARSSGLSGSFGSQFCPGQVGLIHFTEYLGLTQMRSRVTTS